MPYTPLNRSASDTLQDAGRHSSLHLWPTWVSALHNSCCHRSIWRRAIHGKQNLKTSALFYLEAAALETELQQWWRNFRWSQQQQLPKKQQQGLMSRWQRLMEIQVAGRMWLHQLIRRRIGQCLLVAQCAMWWKKRLSLNSCGEWVGVQISNWPQDSWARAQMMQITTYAPSFSGSIITDILTSNGAPCHRFTTHNWVEKDLFSWWGGHWTGHWMGSLCCFSFSLPFPSPSSPCQ